VSFASPFEGFPVTSNWEEAPGQMQNMLEGLYISFTQEHLEIPQEEGESVSGERDVTSGLLPWT